MTFTIKINLGNAEMCESEHVAAAIEAVAVRVRDRDPVAAAAEGRECSGVIRDVNGNSVGTWEVER